MVMTLNLNIYMKRKPKEMKKISLKNADGSFNGKLIAGIISLLIVLIQQILAVFGIKFAGDWTSIVAVVNTVLTILGMLGVITDVQTVNVSEDATGTLEQATNEVDSTSQADKAPTSASVSNVTDISADVKVDDKTE
ncbi:phage holin [Lactiplantibacillus plantarum]